MPEPSHRRPHRLVGVRLGSLERTLFVAAPQPNFLLGMLVEPPAPTRTLQKAYLRAARSLAEKGLIEREQIPQQTRAVDPRRRKPFYRGGRFLLWADPTRRQLVRRTAIWATPFGEGIRLLYRSELQGARPIRWSQRDVDKAERYAVLHPLYPHNREAGVRDMSEMLCDQPKGDPESRETWPEEVTSDEDLCRWRFAVAIARRENRSLGDGSLWTVALELFSSDRAMDELASAAGMTKTPSGTAPLRFRRHWSGVTFSGREADGLLDGHQVS